MYFAAIDTVDGSEIRRLPVHMVVVSHYLQGFYRLKKVVGLGIYEPSTVGAEKYLAVSQLRFFFAQVPMTDPTDI